MKTLRFIGLVLTAILMCVNFTSCSSGGEEPEIPQVPETPQKPSVPEDPKMCTVSINLESLVDVEEMPLGRATSNNDLYAIAIVPNDMYDSFKLSGLFDNTTNIEATLVEGKEYIINVLAIKDGKNNIFKRPTDNQYFYPFQSVITNKLSEGTSSLSFSPDQFDLKDYETTGKGYNIANIEVFSSVASSASGGKTFTAKAGTTIDVPLYRYNAIGTSFKATNMPEGKLHISISASNGGVTSTSPEIIVENEDVAIENIFTFGWSFTTKLEGLYDNSLEATLNLKWVKDNDTAVDLEDATITFKKDTKYIITINANPYTGFNLSINEEAFSSTESYYVVDGTAEKQTN